MEQMCRPALQTGTAPIIQFHELKHQFRCILPDPNRLEIATHMQSVEFRPDFFVDVVVVTDYFHILLRFIVGDAAEKLFS